MYSLCDLTVNLYVMVVIGYDADLNPLERSDNISCRFKQCYSYESTVLKLALLGEA